MLFINNKKKKNLLVEIVSEIYREYFIYLI